MTAASRAKRLHPELDILVLEATRFISYSICGLPYYVAQVVGHHSDLVQFTPESLQEERGIGALTGARVSEIMPGRRGLRYVELKDGHETVIGYEKLVLATGYHPRLPRFVPEHEVGGLLTFNRLEHGLQLRDLTSSRPQAVVVGAGYIGLMMAEALIALGLSVTLLERSRQVFNQIDQDMAELVQSELEENGVRVLLETGASGIVEERGRIRALEIGRGSIPCDLALVDVGVRPNTDLAERAAIPLGMSGGIQVNSRGMTDLTGIFAAGNCAETVHRVTGKPIVSALGTTAAKQGRVVGENLAGRRSEFSGTLETSIEKVFNLGVARTGLTSQQAFRGGFEADSVRIEARDRAAYYPDVQPVHVKLVFERKTLRLLGGQIVGGGQSAKRIDTLVAALSADMTVRDLAQLDLAYAPPFGTLWDPIQIAANVALRKGGSGF